MSEAAEEMKMSSTAFNARNYTSLAALIILVLDHILVCKSEYTYIWRLPIITRAASSIVGFLYIWARYASLITLTIHYIFIHVFLSKGSVSDVHCRTWFLILFAFLSSLIMVLDAVLFLRVYALYCKNKKTLLLVLPITAQFILAALTFICVLGQRGSFDYQCNFRNPKQMNSIFQGASVIIAHAALWIATFARRNVARGPYTLLVRLVVHEGLWVFILLFAIVSGATPQSYTSRSGNPFILFVWPISVISITICRLIMNMRRLKVETIGSDGIHLSTIITMSESHEASPSQITVSTSHIPC